MISQAAPAKINLALHVCGRRVDGYHLLDSLVVFAGVGDAITVLPAHELTLAVTGPFAGALAREPDNLVLKAARFLAGKTGAATGAALTLEKNLPVASGIGGGSSDAAAALVACAKLWGADISRLNDAEVAGRLGADVPVCLRAVPAFMRGIGEEVTRAPLLPKAWLVLANPGVAVATKAVFAALQGRFSPPMEPLPTVTEVADLAAFLATQRNDLTAPAVEVQPVIANVLEALKDTVGCLLARLSGSGPTCFGLFARESEAQAAADAISRSHPGWWVRAAIMKLG